MKSGPSWGNSSQFRRLDDDFKKAEKVLKQSKSIQHVQSVLGICYGRVKTSYSRGYMKITGQNFWHFISGSENLYIDIIEPLGHRAKERNEVFLKQKNRVVNVFTKEFIDEFCVDGIIDWAGVVKLNSGNLSK